MKTISIVLIILGLTLSICGGIFFAPIGQKLFVFVFSNSIDFSSQISLSGNIMSVGINLIVIGLTIYGVKIAKDSLDLSKIALSSTPRMELHLQHIIYFEAIIKKEPVYGGGILLFSMREKEVLAHTPKKIDFNFDESRLILSPVELKADDVPYVKELFTEFIYPIDPFRNPNAYKQALENPDLQRKILKGNSKKQFDLKFFIRNIGNSKATSVKYHVESKVCNYLNKNVEVGDVLPYSKIRSGTSLQEITLSFPYNIHEIDLLITIYAENLNPHEVPMRFHLV